MMPIKANKVSWYTMLALMLLLVLVSFQRLHKRGNIISWDTFGYYLYIPATFLHGDPGLYDTGFVEEALEKYKGSVTFYQASQGPQGGMIIKYSPGLAILFLPGFALAHGLAMATNFPADGFSLPYQYSIFFTSLFFALFGLFMIRKVLQRFFTDNIVAITLIFLFAGTNLFYVSVNHLLVHNFLFALYALLLWLVIRWHETPNKRLSVATGLTMGLIIAIRPSDAICVLIPALWGVFNKETLKWKIRLVAKHWKQIATGFLVMLLPLLPQLIYWKVFTGSFLYYSYDNPGEGLDLLTPYTWDVLFSFRKGWLIYTPMMIMAIYGFKFLYEKRRDLFYPLLVFAVINLYLVSTWTTWWYAGSFGHRAMVQSYAIMALPLGYFLVSLKDMKPLWSKTLWTLAGLFVLLNLFQTWQFFNGIIHPDSMTRPYYQAVFGRISPPTEEMKSLLLVQRSLGADDPFTNPEDYYLYRTFEIDFEGDIWINPNGNAAEKVSDVMLLTPDRPFSPALEIPYNRLTMADHAFIKLKGRVFIEELPQDNPFTLVVTFDHKGGNYKYRGLDMEQYEQELIAGQWNTIETIYLTPEPRRETDELRTYFWLRGQNPVPVDKLELEVWVPKRGW
jgi:hypothetical protein